eukprot:scaffold26035_cov34-Attheya_sp.AAC.4
MKDHIATLLSPKLIFGTHFIDNTPSIIMLRWKKLKAGQQEESSGRIIVPPPSSLSLSSVEEEQPTITAFNNLDQNHQIPECISVVGDIMSVISDSSNSQCSSSSSISYTKPHLLTDDENDEVDVPFHQEPQEGSMSQDSNVLGRKRPLDAVISIIAPTRKVSDVEDYRYSSQSPSKKQRSTTTGTQSSPQKVSPSSQQEPSTQLLALKEDVCHLNAIHVFVRENVEVFTATAEDMSKPAPGRKNPIRLGQVGLRCIHCRHISGKKRIKRAVCYPTSLKRLYHSVSDM